MLEEQIFMGPGVLNFICGWVPNNGIQFTVALDLLYEIGDLITKKDLTVLDYLEDIQLLQTASVDGVGENPFFSKS